MIPDGNKAKLLSSVNHTTKTIHHIKYFWSEKFYNYMSNIVNRDISINGCNLVRADHPTNNKRDSECIYYREWLFVQLNKINYLNECLLCEVSFNNKKGCIAALYRSTSQNWLEFDNSISIFKRCLVIFTLLTLIFKLLLAILMLDQIIGRLGILKYLKAHELILSQLVMALDN